MLLYIFVPPCQTFHARVQLALKKQLKVPAIHLSILSSVLLVLTITVNAQHPVSTPLPTIPLSAHSIPHTTRYHTYVQVIFLNSLFGYLCFLIIYK
jgi:hypothetical protein